MADECVVCGEAEEGKPLYKKLGSGEFNVEVITALKALQMVSIPEAAKNSSYICWDCDELIVEQYDRYLQEQQEVAVLQKQTKKQQQSKKKKKSKPSRLKLKIAKTTKQESSWGIAKPQPQKQSCKKLSSAVSSAASSLSKTKQLEQQRATNAYHYSHCLMCDSNFETESRTYQRFSLKNRVNDEMDIAQVMEVLGLARHIAPNMKARRFVCNPCFFIIRRNYKDKLMKEASSEAKPQLQPPTPVTLVSQSSIHRATTEEHAAEIARLLPPDLAECYKIMTENPGNKKAEAKDTSQTQLNEGSPQAEVEEHGFDEEEGEEEEGALKVSQDEHGNYFIDIDEKRSQGGSKVKAERKQQLAVPRSPRRKKNVLLPKRMHKHLSLSTQNTPEGLSDISSGEEEKEQEDKEEEEKEDKLGPPHSSGDTPQECESSRTCNICGITIAGKQSSWWHTLSSPLTGFDNISISAALKLLETCLASISQGVQEDQSVCLPCYSKVSTGFKSQVVQRIARHKNVDVSEVNLSRVKLRMLPKEALEPVEAPDPVERTTEAGKAGERPSATPPAPEESGEGEKENVNIEKRGHKRKYKEDNVVPDKKTHKSGVDVTTESVSVSTVTEVSQDSILLETPALKSIKEGKRIFCPRAKNGRFLKMNRNNSTRQEQHEAGTPVSSSDQEKNMQDTPAINEGPRRQPRESIEAEPMVVLKDLKFVLPQEAFIGKTVSSHKIESIMEPPSQPSNQLLATHTDLDSNSSPLQLVFSALSVYCPPMDDPMLEVQEASTPEHHVAPKVCGWCVVCGSSFTLPPSSWHTVEDNIRPPTLLVPVRWVCLSLAICLHQVSVEDARLARVCEQCFQRLGDQFEVFVKKKVGESCGLEADAVDLSEYLFTFNPNTMNLEADPKQQSYIHEFEDVGQLLQRIQPLVEQFSLDEVVGEGKRQPLSDQHFCVWLLLVLNELRMQVGAAIGDLAQWLVALMPIEMYESGLRPCPNNLAAFLLNTTRCFRDLTQDMLEGPIPAWVFVANETFQTTDACMLGTSLGNENEDEDVCWEDFLQHVNLDALVGGKAKPVAPAHFTQGLVYAMWRTSRLLGEEENQVMDWLKQLSPLPLSKEELESLVTMIGKLHDHLEEHPGDIHELQCKIIPQLQGNDSEKPVHMVLSTETYESCKSTKNRSSASGHSSSGSKEEENRSEKRPRMKNRKGSPALRNCSQKKNKRLGLDKSCVNANEQESESCRKVYSQGATVGSPLRSTPSREDLDTSYVYNSTNLLLTTPTISTHVSSDQISPDHISHEPHPVNMSHNSHPVTRHTDEQCSRDTTQVTNTIHYKETGASSELCELTADISGPSEDTKDTSETEEKTAITSEKSVSITESAGETVIASELSEEGMATSESSEETVATNGPLEETVATSELSEDIVATSEPSEEALAISDSSVEIVTNSEPSKEAANVTEPTEEISVSTTKCFEEIAANSETSDETVTTSEPSEETVTTGGPSEGTVTTSESSEGTVTTSEPSEGTVTTSKPSEGTVTTSEPSEGTVMTSEPPKGTVATSETSEWTVTTTEPSVGAVTISESSKRVAVTSRSSEETVATTEPPVETVSITKSPEEMTATTKIPEETLATTEPSEETETASESLSEALATAESSEETTSITEPSEEVAATTEPAEETAVVIGETNATCLPKAETEGITEPFGVTAVPVKPSKETATIAESADKTTSTIESTEETMTSTDPSEKTATTTREAVVSTDLVEETVITHGLCKDPKVTTGPLKDTETITEETAGIVRSSEESIATSTSSTASAGMTVTTSQAQTAANRTDVITSTITTRLILCSPPSKLQVVTPCPEDNANNLQVGITEQGPKATKNIVLGSAKTPHLAPTLVKTNASSNTTLISPSQKDNSVTTKQYSAIKVSQNEASSKKTSCQALGSGSQVLLEKSHGEGSQKISGLQSALRESPETQAELEQKNEGHFISEVKENCSSSGSKKTVTLRSKHHGLSNTSAKVPIVTPPNRVVDKQHQMNKGVSHGKEKESLQLLNKCQKTDAPLKKNQVLPSKDTGPISNKRKLSLEMPVLSTRSPLHRSERVCIKVLTTSPESTTLESHNSENSVGGSKGIVWQYHDPCKERQKTEKMGDAKDSHSSSPTLLWSHQEGKEDNNNGENPSLCHPRTSSKSVVKFVNSAPIKDRLKHPAKSEKYKLGDTKPITVQIVKEKNQTLLDKRYRNTVSIKKITATGDKKHKNTSVEFQYNKEKVEEMPQKSITEKNTVVRIFHKQVSIKPVKEELHGNKTFHEKMPGKSLLSEEKEQPKKGKFSSPVARPERSCSSVTTPCDRGATSRTPQEPSEKKQKLSFEELMNYDVAGIGHS